jgi:hypothetical protein
MIYRFSRLKMDQPGPLRQTRGHNVSKPYLDNYQRLAGLCGGARPSADEWTVAKQLLGTEEIDIAGLPLTVRAGTTLGVP